MAINKKTWISKLLLLGLLNAGAYHLAYIEYLFAIFQYAGFRYESTSAEYMTWTYLIAALPLLIVRKSNNPSAVGCALIYVLSYVPIQLTLTFMWVEKTAELLLLQTLLGISMAILFRVSYSRELKNIRTQTSLDIFFEPGRLTYTIYFLSAMSLLFVITELHSLFRFVSFDSVYDLRSDAAEIHTSTLTKYSIMWLTYCFGPFFVARALLKRGKLDWLVCLIIFIVIYSTTGSKIALLTPFFSYAMYKMDSDRGEFLQNILVATTTFIGLALTIIPSEGIARWINSILLMRVFGSNGWVASVYYEYFSEHSYTYYTHIGPVNAIFGTYPYGDRSLGQEIGQFYFANEANFNAGFWASDGFAALGMFGLPIITLFLAIVLKLLNMIAHNFSSRMLNLWLLGFWMALLNAPLTTALLSGGGLLVGMLLVMVRPVAHKNNSTYFVSEPIKAIRKD